MHAERKAFHPNQRILVCPPPTIYERHHPSLWYTPVPQSLRSRSHRTQSTLRKAPRKQWDTLLQMGVFTQVARNIKGFAGKFACKSAYASCVNWA